MEGRLRAATNIVAAVPVLERVASLPAAVQTVAAVVVLDLADPREFLVAVVVRALVAPSLVPGVPFAGLVLQVWVHSDY